MQIMNIISPFYVMKLFIKTPKSQAIFTTEIIKIPALFFKSSIKLFISSFQW